MEILPWALYRVAVHWPCVGLCCLIWVETQDSSDIPVCFIRFPGRAGAGMRQTLSPLLLCNRQHWPCLFPLYIQKTAYSQVPYRKKSFYTILHTKTFIKQGILDLIFVYWYFVLNWHTAWMFYRPIKWSHRVPVTSASVLKPVILCACTVRMNKTVLFLHYWSDQPLFSPSAS